MLGIHRLRNQIQAYSWGSRLAIAELLGKPAPTDEPQAELWMGAHPQAPSSIEIDGRWVSLARVLAEAPVELLGRRVMKRFGTELPFLFKVLAAERALSIQAHPDRRQAVAGYRRENARGLSPEEAGRNYRDDRHKPEVLYALTPFWILRGFRPAAEVLSRFRELGLPELAPEIGEALAGDDSRRFFTAYMALDEPRWAALLSTALERAESRHGQDPVCTWILKLERQFPEDRGVLAPLFLNLVELLPGQAIFTGPGVLHAYLSGVGIELMANSDNVVRGGLTSKHVDVDELLEILRFEAQPPRLLTTAGERTELRIQTEVEEFALGRLEVTPREPHLSGGDGGVQILLCTEGSGTLASPEAEIKFSRGDSFLVAAKVPSYDVTGSATLFRARVPRI